MDDIVKAALAKWPNVPHCTGWLALDARGDWYMRDDRIQAVGPFPKVKGSRIDHDKLKAFIERNYDHDANGCWFFQNGPQRVYVELESAPWVWRVADAAAGFALSTHTGRAARCASTWLDEHDHLFVDSPEGFGLVHSLDTTWAADAIETGAWPAPQSMLFNAMPARFGYCLSPHAGLGAV